MKYTMLLFTAFLAGCVSEKKFQHDWQKIQWEMIGLIGDTKIRPIIYEAYIDGEYMVHVIKYKHTPAIRKDYQ
jgi:hypothetical protein